MRPNRPAAASSIRVRAALASLGAALVLAAPSARAAGPNAARFDDPIKLLAAPTPVGLVLGDFDGDGSKDVVTAEVGGPTVVTIRRNDGTGKQFTNDFFLVSGNLEGVAAGDFDKDDKLDLVIAVGGALVVEHNVGVNASNQLVFGGFTPLNSGTAAGLHSVAVADVDNDGFLDVVASGYSLDGSNNPGPGVVAVFRNDHTGGFQTPQVLDVADAPTRVATGDVDGDGRADAVVAHPGGKGVTVLRAMQDGTARFETPTFVATTDAVAAVALGDVTGDGLPDLLAFGYRFTDPLKNETLVAVMRNVDDGAGRFGKMEANATFVVAELNGLGATPIPGDVVLRDVNSDGKPEIVVADFITASAKVLYIDAVKVLGQFDHLELTLTTNHPANAAAAFVAVADLNFGIGTGFDSFPDVVTANTSNNGVNVLMSLGLTTPPPDPSKTLAFTNPLVAGPGSNRDLGDAARDTIPTRRVQAKGGTPPYTFTATSLPAPFVLQTDGTLTATQAVTLTGPILFDVTVKDAATAQQSLTETFVLNMVEPTQFRFGASALADGQMFRSYGEALPIIGGTGPYRFTASEVMVEGEVAGSLEAVGLSLSADGRVFGTPTPFPSTLTQQTITFKATATDSTNATAAGRDGTGTSQTFTIFIGPNALRGNVVAVTKMSVKTGFGAGKDRLAISGVALLPPTGVVGLAGQTVSVRVGRYVAPTAAFNAKGVAATPKGLKPSASYKVGTNGAFTGAVVADTIAVGTVVGPTADLAVEIRIGDRIVGSQVLRFAVKPGKLPNQATLTYAAATAVNTAGLGIVTSVGGADAKNGAGDAWTVKFVAVPPTSLDLSTTTGVQVVIGGFDRTVAATVKGTKITAKGDKTLPGIAAFAYDRKTGLGSFTTGVLASGDTGIPLAQIAGSPRVFPLTLAFRVGTTSLFAFESAVLVHPAKAKWTSVPQPAGRHVDRMTASIDGVPFIANHFDLVLTTAANTLDVIGIQNRSTEPRYQRIALTGSPITGAGTYVVQGTYESGTSSAAFTQHVDIAGELVITTFDLAGKHVVGTFKFTSAEVVETDRVHVTDGFFDIDELRTVQ